VTHQPLASYTADHGLTAQQDADDHEAANLGRLAVVRELGDKHGQHFASWLAKQADRGDLVGELARAWREGFEFSNPILLVAGATEWRAQP